jgi:hypothetical protein
MSHGFFALCVNAGMLPARYDHALTKPGDDQQNSTGPGAPWNPRISGGQDTTAAPPSPSARQTGHH